MAEEIVRILKVDTKNSGKSIKELRNEIKGLRSELDKAVVGSEEFESTLKQLTQTQKTYNNLQQQIKDMTRSNQQDMAKMASFARNLGKAYSAANAAIGLFADGNEDVQKAMLKVQRTIQLIQGLDGIAGLVRDLPKVANLFKGWLSFLDPIERKITNIIKGINGANPSKLKAINEAGRAGAGAGSNASASATVYGNTAQQTQAQTQALQEQTQVITALNSAREAEIKKLTQLQKEQNELLASTDGLTKKADVAYETWGRLASQYEVAETELEGLAKQSKSLEEFQANPRAKELSERMADLNKQMSQIKQNIQQTTAEANQGVKALGEAQVGIEQTKQKVSELDVALQSAGKAAKATTTFLKTLGKTVGWTVVIAFAVGLVMKLLDALGLTVDKIWDFITGANSAAKATKQLNKEISEMTNQNSAKALISLRQLSEGFKKVGDSAEAKKKFLDDYKNKIQETGLAIDTVEEAEDVFVKNTGKYVEAIKQRAKAQAMEAALVKIYTEYMDERYDLEQKLDKAESNNRERRTERMKRKIAELDKEYDERSSKLIGLIAELEGEYAGIFASLEASTSKGGQAATDWVKEYKDALEAIKKYNQERLDMLKDARTRELDENKRAYEEDVKNIQENYEKGVKAAQGNKQKLLEIENEKNKALKLALVTYERERLDIIKKYDEEELERQKRSLDRQYNLLEKQIERNRKLYDTSNLKDPSKVSYQTQYKQKTMTRGLGLLGLGTKEDWVNVYQSKKNIEQQYKDQVEYNNKVYELTKRRVDNEQKLLEQEKITLENKAKLLRDELNKTDVNDLEKRQTLADEIIDIEHSLFTTKQTIAENEMALDDAQRENEQANLEILLETQEKKREALNATLDVVSNLSGAMADMFKMEAQNTAEGSKRQKAATKAYKALAITQAIADTYKGANEAYAAMASIPYVGPALGIAAAAAAIAMGIANVKRIISESISGGTQQASVSAPAPVDTAPINYSRNLIGDKELDNINQPIKCYVLESEITNTQNKVKVTEQNATF